MSIATEERHASSKPAAPYVPPPFVLPGQSGDEGVRLIEIFGAIWKGKWLISLTIILVMALVSVVIATATPQYEVTATLTPAEQEKGGSAAEGLSGVFGQFASLAGGGQSQDSFARFKMLTGSLIIAQRLDEQHGYLRRVYSDAWDAENQRWAEPPAGLVAETKKAIVRAFGMTAWTPPSDATLSDYLKSQIELTETKDGPLTMTMTHADADFAVQLMSDVIAETEAYLKEQAAKQADARLAHLRDLLRQESNTIYRQILMARMTDIEQRQFMLGADLPYAAEIVDPPHASPLPVFPRPVFMLALAGLSGTFLGIMIVIIRQQVRAARSA